MKFVLCNDDTVYLNIEKIESLTIYHGQRRYRKCKRISWRNKKFKKKHPFLSRFFTLSNNDYKNSSLVDDWEDAHISFNEGDYKISFKTNEKMNEYMPKLKKYIDFNCLW